MKNNILKSKIYLLNLMLRTIKKDNKVAIEDAFTTNFLMVEGGSGDNERKKYISNNLRTIFPELYLTIDIIRKDAIREEHSIKERQNINIEGIELLMDAMKKKKKNLQIK